LDEFAEALAPGTSAAMEVATALTFPEPRSEQPSPERVGRDVASTSLQDFTGEGRSEVGEVGGIDFEHLFLERLIKLTIGLSTSKSMDDACIAIGLVATLYNVGSGVHCD
jgi:hypothetical protein